MYICNTYAFSYVYIHACGHLVIYVCTKVDSIATHQVSVIIDVPVQNTRMDIAMVVK